MFEFFISYTVLAWGTCLRYSSMVLDKCFFLLFRFWVILITESHSQSVIKVCFTPLRYKISIFSISSTAFDIKKYYEINTFISRHQSDKTSSDWGIMSLLCICLTGKHILNHFSCRSFQSVYFLTLLLPKYILLTPCFIGI